ncbi:hypothetical protein [Xanthomonas albilineans]|uniref:hypothetical protein n=1 Tax=Xanthomonas albilineans TaxID=29447 RepID=UPI0005F3104E|nr:hypothetical protein [Xanthomonas albilineans]
MSSYMRHRALGEDEILSAMLGGTDCIDLAYRGFDQLDACQARSIGAMLARGRSHSAQARDSRVSK